MDHVRYIDRTREDYIRQGYDKPYEWANFADVPFTPLKKPLSQCRVGLIGTSEVAVRFDPATVASYLTGVQQARDPAAGVVSVRETVSSVPLLLSLIHISEPTRPY